MSEKSAISAKLDLLIEMMRGLRTQMDRHDDRLGDVNDRLHILSGKMSDHSNSTQTGV